MIRRVWSRRRSVHDADALAGVEGACAKPAAPAPGTVSEGAHGSACARGSHRIFLGYAPGVGKTYAMLIEARLRAARGEDIVVGHLEPHIRPDTRALAETIEHVPPKRVAYHGSEFAELDTEAVIARHPEWVIVDEFAHTNVPGAGHEKRWQSVEEILDAGIGVLSTMNVQHIESLNDYVYQVSGVRVAETVPDAVVEPATIVLVDLDPEDLLVRVKRGLVLTPNEVGHALTHFFRKATLVALRDQALAIARSNSADASGLGGHA